MCGLADMQCVGAAYCLWKRVTRLLHTRQHTRIQYFGAASHQMRDAGCGAAAGIAGRCGAGSSRSPQIQQPSSSSERGPPSSGRLQRQEALAGVPAMLVLQREHGAVPLHKCRQLARPLSDLRQRTHLT